MLVSIFSINLKILQTLVYGWIESKRVQKMEIFCLQKFQKLPAGLGNLLTGSGIPVILRGKPKGVVDVTIFCHQKLA